MTGKIILDMTEAGLQIAASSADPEEVLAIVHAAWMLLLTQKITRDVIASTQQQRIIAPDGRGWH